MKRKIRELLEEKGSEVYKIALGKTLKDATKMFLEKIKFAFCLLIMTCENEIYCVRDCYGYRPLCLAGGCRRLRLRVPGLWPPRHRRIGIGRK